MRRESLRVAVSKRAHGGRIRWRGTDALLLERCQRQPTAAAGPVFDRFERDVNRLVWRLLGGDPEHEDIVHDVFERILRGIARVRQAERLQGWVVRLTINQVRTVLRRRRVRRLMRLTPYVDRWSSAQPDVEGGDLLRLVHRLLDQLPPQERIALMLRRVEQLTLPEIAESTGCSLATVKRRLRRARERFAALAAQYPELASYLSNEGVRDD